MSRARKRVSVRFKINTVGNSKSSANMLGSKQSMSWRTTSTDKLAILARVSGCNDRFLQTNEQPREKAIVLLRSGLSMKRWFHTNGFLSTSRKNALTLIVSILCKTRKSLMNDDGTFHTQLYSMRFVAVQRWWLVTTPCLAKDSETIFETQSVLKHSTCTWFI